MKKSFYIMGAVWVCRETGTVTQDGSSITLAGRRMRLLETVLAAWPDRITAPRLACAIGAEAATVSSQRSMVSGTINAVNRELQSAGMALRILNMRDGDGDGYEAVAEAARNSAGKREAAAPAKETPTTARNHAEPTPAPRPLLPPRETEEARRLRKLGWARRGLCRRYEISLSDLCLVLGESLDEGA